MRAAGLRTALRFGAGFLPAVAAGFAAVLARVRLPVAAFLAVLRRFAVDFRAAGLRELVPLWSPK